MVGLHTASAQAIEEDGARVPCQLTVDQVGPGLHPVVVAHGLATPHLGDAIFRHVHRDGLQATSGEWGPEYRRHLPAIGAHAMEQDHLQWRLGIAVAVQVDSVLPPIPPFLARLISRLQLVRLG
ncbi:hypothetical protein D3C76_997680 [compost metagenome]